MQNNTMHQRVMNSVGNVQMKSYEREQLHKSVKYESFVNGYAARIAGYYFLVGFCGVPAIFTIIGLWNGTSYPVTPLLFASMMTGGTVAGIAGGISLSTAKARFTPLATTYEGAELETPQAETTPRDVMIYNGEPIDKTRQDVMVDGFRFDGVNLDELHRRYLRGIVKVKRDSSDGVDDGFNTLPIPYTTSTYHTVKTVLEKNGFIENSKWTPRGVDFIKGE